MAVVLRTIRDITCPPTGWTRVHLQGGQGDISDGSEH